MLTFIDYKLIEIRLLGIKVLAKLVKCKSCGNEISKKASSCPKCGHPVKKSSKFKLFILVVITLSFISIFSSYEDYSDRAATTYSKPTPKVDCFSGDPSYKLQTKNDGDAETIDYLLAEARKIPASDLKANMISYCVIAEGATREDIAKLATEKYEFYSRKLAAENKAYDKLKNACRNVAYNQTDQAGKSLELHGISAFGPLGDKGKKYVDYNVRGQNAFGAKVMNTIRCVGSNDGTLESLDLQ